MKKLVGVVLAMVLAGSLLAGCGSTTGGEKGQDVGTSAGNEQTVDIAAQTLRIEKTDKKFAFSCLPYTSIEIENATHHEELPPARRTVLCIYGAVRGVGGIDSWGSDVEQTYHISAEEDIRYSFAIC